MTAILHRGLRNGFFFSSVVRHFRIYFFQFLFGLLFPFSIWTFISLFYLDFYLPFLFGLLFLFGVLFHFPSFFQFDQIWSNQTKSDQIWPNLTKSACLSFKKLKQVLKLKLKLKLKLELKQELKLELIWSDLVWKKIKRSKKDWKIEKRSKDRKKMEKSLNSSDSV